jgi:hypothetical protein
MLRIEKPEHKVIVCFLISLLINRIFDNLVRLMSVHRIMTGGISLATFINGGE